MRIVVSSVSCEWCESAFEAPEEDMPLDQALDQAGWFLVSHNGEESDFCSSECVVRFYS